MKLLVVIAGVIFLAGCVRSPVPNSVDNTLAAQSRLELGMAYLMHGDLQAAKQNLERALSHNPADYRTQLGMALYAQQIGENTLAASHYQRALNLSPKNDKILNNYGAFLCGLGQYEAAQRQFSMAVDDITKEQSVESLENSGYCFLQAEKWVETKARLSRVLKSDPRKGVVLLNETEQLLEKKQWPQAEVLLDIYQYELPASAISLWLQIRLAAQGGDKNNIERYGQQLAQRFPHSQQYKQFLANEY